jgi:hypothetical protein
MRAELEALQEAVEDASGMPAHLIDVPSGSGTRYCVIEPAGFARPDDLSLSGASSAWDGTVRVKAVHTLPTGAMRDLDAVRDALVPNGRLGSLDVTGRAVTLTFLRHEADDVEDVTIAETNRRLAVSLDSYTLTSVPA